MILLLWPLIGIGLHIYFCLTDDDNGSAQPGWIMDDGSWILMIPLAAFIGPLYLISYWMGKN